MGQTTRTPATPPIEEVFDGLRMRHLPDWPGYLAGEDGHVYSAKKGYPKRLKAVRVCRKGRRNPFWAVTVYSDKIRYGEFNRVRPTPVLIHRLIASVWLPPRPSRRHEIDHIDTDRRNNAPSNLRWLTKRRNTQRFWAANPLAHRGEANPFARLTAERVRELRALQGRVTQRMAAGMFGVAATTVGSIWHRRTWTHV
jgi:hypothetical protein